MYVRDRLTTGLSTRANASASRVGTFLGAGVRIGDGRGRWVTDGVRGGGVTLSSFAQWRGRGIQVATRKSQKTERRQAMKGVIRTKGCNTGWKEPGQGRFVRCFGMGWLGCGGAGCDCRRDTSWSALFTYMNAWQLSSLVTQSQETQTQE